MKRRGGVRNPWMFLVVTAPLCFYYVALSVMTAVMCGWYSFGISLITVALLAVLVPVGVIAQLRCDKAKTEISVPLVSFTNSDECDNDNLKQHQEQSSRMPRCLRCSSTVSRFQEEKPANNAAAGNDFNNNNNNNNNNGSNDTRPPLLSRDSRQSTTASASLSSSTSTDAKSMALPVLRQTWLQGETALSSFDDKKTSEKQAYLKSQKSDHNASMDSTRLESLTKISLAMQQPSNQPPRLLDFSEEEEKPNPTLEEIRSLNRELESRRPMPFSFYSQTARGGTPLVFSSIEPLPVILQWVSIISLIVLIILLLAGSFWLAYNAKEGIAAIPVFYAPFFLVHFMHLFKTVSRDEKESVKSICISFLSHPTTSLFTVIVGIILYIFAVVHSLLVNWTEPSVWGCNDTVSMAMRAVFYFSPLPLLIGPWFTRRFTVVPGQNGMAGAVAGRCATPHRSPSVPRASRGQSQLNPYHHRHASTLRMLMQSDNEVDEGDLSSIHLSHSPSASSTRGCNPSRRSIAFSPPGTVENLGASIHLGVPVTFHPQVKSVTLLYVAYRDTRMASNSTSTIGERREYTRNKSPKELQEIEAANFQALLNAAKEMEPQHGPFVLTAHRDTLCFVCGVQPFSADPILWAVDTANDFLKVFVPPTKNEGSYALVAAVLHSPHALISILGSGEMSTVHFLGDEHYVGEQLLSRGFLLRNLEKQKRSGKAFSTSGILLDSRAAHLAAARILCRPVGIVPSVSFASITGTTSSGNTSSFKSLLENFTVIYDFFMRLTEKQEEWHLAVQAREHRSAGFLPAVEAAQAFFQGNLDAARRALENSTNNENDALLQIMLSDVDNIIALSKNSGKLKE
ncbi:hypothetical protein LSM04_002882 [Trypanosoma melophagium]|uniref:uncharacterized protein n=1 Tax=Trypanosoma melophagium TaxID=715481 RepID=UPI00351A2756|nr:hypothetical protein LSM04_002882 [Trypanosoma melophagium]